MGKKSKKSKVHVMMRTNKRRKRKGPPAQDESKSVNDSTGTGKVFASKIDASSSQERLESNIDDSAQPPGENRDSSSLPPEENRVSKDPSRQREGVSSGPMMMVETTSTRGKNNDEEEVSCVSKGT